MLPHLTGRSTGIDGVIFCGAERACCGRGTASLTFPNANRPQHVKPEDHSLFVLHAAGNPQRGEQTADLPNPISQRNRQPPLSSIQCAKRPRPGCPETNPKTCTINIESTIEILAKWFWKCYANYKQNAFVPLIEKDSFPVRTSTS